MTLQSIENLVYWSHDYYEDFGLNFRKKKLNTSKLIANLSKHLVNALLELPNNLYSFQISYFLVFSKIHYVLPHASLSCIL